MLQSYKNKIDILIKEYLINRKSEIKSSFVFEMIEYVLVNDSKKLRAILALICAEIINIDIYKISNYLLAIEIMHTYTLVHDDLPSLDNDDMRREKLTVHKVFGEANAILLGDILQTLAFELFTQENNNFDSKNILKAANEFARTLGGLEGVIYGQILDINNDKIISKENIDTIHLYKTAIFFRFCMSLPMILNNEDEEKIEFFKNFAIRYGVAFQLLDDIEDFEMKKEESNICNIIGAENAKILYMEMKSNLNCEFDIINQFVQSTLKDI